MHVAMETTRVIEKVDDLASGILSGKGRGSRHPPRGRGHDDTGLPVWCQGSRLLESSRPGTEEPLPPRAAEEGVTRAKLEEVREGIERDVERFRELLDGEASSPRRRRMAAIVA